MKAVFLTLLLMCISEIVFCKNGGEGDSTQKVKTTPSFNMKLVARFHTKGQFTYGGRIVSDNPTMDLNFTYDRKAWGFQLYKAIDLRDHSTPINFTLAVFNKRFQLSKRLTVTPSAGVILEQYNTLCDHGSDFAFILNTGYKISNTLTIDHSALFGNLVLEPGFRDWVNRLRLSYSKKHLDISVSAWHNNELFDEAEYWTYGSSIFWSRMKLTSFLSMNAGISGLIMPYTNDTTNYPKKDGVFATVAFTLD